MLGQYTETTDDFETAMDLMKKSVRSNPNIQYNFTITTPFPGSELYDLIFQKGYLRDHREFCEKYFATSKEWKQVVNLSEMSDEEVVQMHKRITRSYWMEKVKASGAGVFIIGGAQVALGKLNAKALSKIRARAGTSRISGRLSRRIDSGYVSTLSLLDTYRLRLQGICAKEQKPL